MEQEVKAHLDIQALNQLYTHLLGDWHSNLAAAVRDMRLRTAPAHRWHTTCKITDAKQLARRQPPRAGQHKNGKSSSTHGSADDTADSREPGPTARNLAAQLMEFACAATSTA